MLGGVEPPRYQVRADFEFLTNEEPSFIDFGVTFLPVVLEMSPASHQNLYDFGNCSMKKEQLCTRLATLLPCTMLAFAVGCGSGGSSTLPPPGITIAISPQASAIGLGQNTTFSVVTNDTTGVTWTASEGTIDASGNYMAPAGPQGTTATVTATSKQDSTKRATATVNVVPPGTLAPTSNGESHCTPSPPSPRGTCQSSSASIRTTD